ncbi:MULTISPECIES: hypothetical protein [Pseudomonas]|jgi:hypothetical protein|uniref:Immunity protein n=1 Tax=Pseudomonas mosselii TaxID=78327 RepID=A0A5R8ZG31_9PSED|nr:hypothetical protein [Pseudomonas mosselii]TLP64720.1 hypothetical protein FEM01_00655 [Pseudomonas mosselii]
MNSIYEIVTNEKPIDVILFLIGRTSIDHPKLDRLYSLSGWPHIDNMLLIELIESMRLSGLIASENGRYVKGPNWKAPQFMLEKKYTL